MESSEAQQVLETSEAQQVKDKKYPNRSWRTKTNQLVERHPQTAKSTFTSASTFYHVAHAFSGSSPRVLPPRTSL
jgi:hypothetical protein